MDGSGSLELSGSQDSDEADDVVSMLESCIDWDLDSESVTDLSDNHNGGGHRIPSFTSNNLQSHELQGRSVGDFLDGILLVDVRRSPPPAARFVVERLTKVVMKEKTDEVCVICREEIKKGEKVYKLPSSHYYHGNCIKPWLIMRNTCPICRFELPEKDSKTG